jgi:hypothetical protein
MATTKRVGQTHTQATIPLKIAKNRKSTINPLECNDICQ